MSEPRKTTRTEDLSQPLSVSQQLGPLKIAVGSGYVFTCFFLFGPLFGLISLFFGSGLTPAEFLDKRFMMVYLPALVLVGIQAYRCGLRVTDFLEAEGYVSFRHVLQSSFWVGFTPSCLVALIAFVGALSAHEPWCLAYWPIIGFAVTMGVHIAAALAVSIMIIPLMRRPKNHLPTT